MAARDQRWRSRSRSRSPSPMYRKPTTGDDGHQSPGRSHADAVQQRESNAPRRYDSGRSSTPASSAATGGPVNRATGEVDDTIRSQVKEQANFGLSGALAEDQRTGNVYKGVVMKWSEPPDAATPKLHWQLHIFKGDKAMKDPFMLNRQSAFLVGRDRAIADLPTDHPSCSKQHAVLQFRRVPVQGTNTVVVHGAAQRTTVKPYIMDLESANGTWLNGERVAAARYIELKATDVLKFGASSRDYVLLHDKV